MYGFRTLSLEERPLHYYETGTPRIDPDIKKDWVEALRSGKYPQGLRRLKTAEGRFCCLGVYCEIAGVPKYGTVRPMGGPGLDEPFEYETLTMYGDPGNANYLEIPNNYGIPWIDSQPNELGFTGSQGIFMYYAPFGAPENPMWSVATLPQLNDSGLTFDQIADVIDYFL